MQLFINECSLHSQFFTKKKFTDAVKVFFSLFNYLNENRINKTVFKSAYLFTNFKALKEELFVKSLNSLSDKSLHHAVTDILFNRQKIIDWNREQQHSVEDLFEYDDESVTNTSMGELAERKLRDFRLICVLINFPNSRFENMKIVQIIKNREQEVDLECVENRQTLEKWLYKHSLLNLYDYSSKETPTDKQTVLSDSRRFKPAPLPPQDGRKVYIEIDSGYYWYVDNLHFGKSAHLEVFKQNGDHLGEADLEGNIITSKVDKNKKLKT
jgi:hypothetical protein